MTKRFNNVGSYLYDNDEPIGSYNDVKVRDDVTDLLNQLNDENEQLKSEIKDFQDLLASRDETFLKPIIRTIEEAYTTERTQIGRNVLKQLLESLE